MPANRVPSLSNMLTMDCNGTPTHCMEYREQGLGNVTARAPATGSQRLATGPYLHTVPLIAHVIETGISQIASQRPTLIRAGRNPHADRRNGKWITVYRATFHRPTGQSQAQLKATSAVVTTEAQRSGYCEYGQNEHPSQCGAVVLADETT
ncbi:hypothetical protein EDB83DRAFT_2317736 [Lactarius deliciosus]|nr:hypothetical protein EDB83DRAFT_2317736 [Lactarius deliciosus]